MAVGVIAPQTQFQGPLPVGWAGGIASPRAGSLLTSARPRPAQCFSRPGSKCEEQCFPIIFSALSLFHMYTFVFSLNHWKVGYHGPLPLNTSICVS